MRDTIQLATVMNTILVFIYILFRTGLVKLCQKQVILTYLPEFRFMYSIKKEVSKHFLTKITS